MADKGISVIICCYNSSSRIPETLSHLASQQVNNFPWEIIIVNNASTDDTANVSEKEWKKYALSNTCFKVVNEFQPGLNKAREKGVQESKYDYLVFCDDDNWFEKYYLNFAYYLLEEHPEAAAIGGMSTIATNGILPDWFLKHGENYAVGKQGKTSGNISERCYLWGAGLILRKRLFEEAFSSIPSLLTDRKGNDLSSGGDSEMCMRFLLMGYKLYYDERLKFIHFITSERLTEAYRDRMYTSFKESDKILNIYLVMIRIKSLNFKKRIYELCAAFSRYLFYKIFSINRVNYFPELLRVYYFSGIKLGHIPKPSIQVRKFFKIHN